MPRIRDSYSAAGKSLLEKLWDELDTVMDCLKSGEYGPPGMPAHNIGGDVDLEDVSNLTESCIKWGELRGQAQGVAFAIATIENPYYPSVPNVKARAVDRWEARQD